MSRKKTSELQRFLALTDADKDKEVARFERGMNLRDTRPLSPSQRKLWNKARKKRGRPRVGKGVAVISLSVEKTLLRKADQVAKSEGISRAAVFARGIEVLLKRAS